MIEKDKLRKADVFSGTLMFLFGILIVSQGLQMPMKDSYAGVQNVWYVSPAVFPLFVGGMITLLGLLLIRTALKSVGREGIMQVLRYLTSSDFADFLRQPATIRFYGIVLMLFVFVFQLVPRVDFFFAATLFLLVFFFMFYCGTDADLPRLMYLIIAGSLILGIHLFSGLAGIVDERLPFSADYMVLLFIVLLIVHYYKKVRPIPERYKKFKLSLLIGLAAPFTIGIIFKYFLLVPMPFEGLVVYLLDAVWYADFWS